MAEIADIIKGSIAEISEDAEETDGSAENETEVPAETESETPETVVDDEKSADKAEKPAADAEVPADETKAEALLNEEDKTLLQDLRDLGIKVKDINVNNRMPYKRHLRVLINEGKRLRDRLTGEHTKALTEREQRAVAAEAASKEAKDLEALALSDPDRYIGVLAAMHPEKFGKFINRQPQQETATPAGKEDPRPGPDLKYEDGSFGYSPERFEAVLDWKGRQVANQVTETLKKEYDGRLRPIENKSKAQQDFETRQQQRAERITADVTAVYRQWGKERVEAHQKDIFAYLDTHKAERPTLADAVAAVLIPKMDSDRAKVRADLLKEQNERPAAARKTTKTDGAGGEESPSGDPVRDAIVRSVAALKGRG